MEMLGVASIMPFVALLTDPRAFEQALALSPVGRLLPAGFSLPPVHVVGIVVVALFVATNLLSLFSLWVSIRFSARLGVSVAQELAASYLRSGYLFLQEKGAAVLANDVTRETEKLAAGSALQLCLLISKSIQVMLILILLSAVSPVFMLSFSIGAAVLYVGIYQLLRRRIAHAGIESVEAVADSSRKANDLFSAAKEILVKDNAPYFIRMVGVASRRYFQADAVARLAPVVPKYLIELTAFTALLSVPIYRSLSGEEYQSVVPLITLFAYAGYRILPAVQQVYSSFSILKFYDALAVRIAGVIRNADALLPRSQRGELVASVDRAIVLSKISCRHPQQETQTLLELSLVIERGDTLAIIGPSGAGKSTLLDVLLGLMPITSGTLSIDGRVCVSGSIPWAPGAVGYAPQMPTIIAASVAQNIAFGVEEIDIDIERCKDVARLACVDDVIGGMPSGFATQLGEGVSLSGGESQRLSIARALYQNPGLLVMDEPSSALDPMIALRVMKNLTNLGASTTLVVVTHDWDLLPCFSKVAIIESGKISAFGQPAELAAPIAALRDRLADEGVPIV